MALISGKRFTPGDTVMCTQTPDKNASFKAGMTGEVVKNPKYDPSNMCMGSELMFLLENGKKYMYWYEHENCYDRVDEEHQDIEPLPPESAQAIEAMKMRTPKQKLADIIKAEVNLLKQR